MNIAIFEPSIGGIGGAQKVIARYSNYLQSKGHKVELFTQRYAPETAYEGFEKLKINIVKPTVKIFSPFTFFKKFKGFDIHITNGFPSNFISIRNKYTIWICYSPTRYFYDLKKITFEQASICGKILLSLKNLLFKKIDLSSAKKMDIILPISENVQKRVKKYYKKDAPNIFYPGVDFNEYKRGEYDDYLLCVSRLEGPKRVDMIVKSMNFVKNKKIKLYIVGDGSEREKIKKLCEKKDNVKFIGKVEEEKLRGLYSNCLAVIYCPIDEDWGLVPIEAAASEKLTLGVNEGGLKETIIDGQTGFLLNKPSPQKIAKKIDCVANNKKIAKKMGIEAKKYAKKYDWKFILPKFEKLVINTKNQNNKLS